MSTTQPVATFKVKAGTAAERYDLAARFCWRALFGTISPPTVGFGGGRRYWEDHVRQEALDGRVREEVCRCVEPWRVP